jgi:hypothetical protein
MPATLLSDVFAAALALAALLVAVFGFLYSLYAGHLARLDERTPKPPPILPYLRTMCRILSVLTALTVLVAGAAVLGLQVPSLAFPGPLAAALVFITASAAGCTIYLAFATMGE